MPTNLVKPRPTLQLERGLVLDGKCWIAGADEVGVGAIAGPLVAAALMLPLCVRRDDLDERVARLMTLLEEVRDSKQVRSRDQERLCALVTEVAAPHVSVSVVQVAELEAIGNQMRSARLATARALEGLPRVPDVVLEDGRLEDGRLGSEPSTIPVIPVGKVYNGTPSLTIAAASIVANVSFRRIMAQYGSRYPAYGFARHAGYPSPEHLAALTLHGPSPIHHRHNRLVRSAGRGPGWRPLR